MNELKVQTMSGTSCVVAMEARKFSRASNILAVRHIQDKGRCWVCLIFFICLLLARTLSSAEASAPAAEPPPNSPPPLSSPPPNSPPPLNSPPPNSPPPLSSPPPNIPPPLNSPPIPLAPSSPLPTPINPSLRPPTLRGPPPNSPLPTPPPMASPPPIPLTPSSPPAMNCAGTCAVVVLTIQADDFPQEVEWALKVVQNADVDAGGNAPGSVSVPVSATVCDTVPITNRGRIASGTLPDLTPGVFFQQEISGICTSTEYEIKVLDSFGDGTSRERTHPFPGLSTG